MQPVLYLQRLTELLMSGHTADASKRLPKGLNNEVWARLVHAIGQDRKA